MAFRSISDVWDKWNIRGILILSLSLQVFLILCASLRKKISNPHIISLLWLAYLMADWVVALGIGLISHSQGNLSAHATKVDEALQAFWASFLLLHLGGPDTITAFSIEDSSLWRRHLLSLIYKVGIAIYVFVQIFSSDKSLVIPTMLVFLTGVIKNAERILALYLSSLPELKKWVKHPSLELGMDGYRKLLEDAYSELIKELEVPRCGYSNEEQAKLAESIVVKHAYFFFDTFKIFLSDLFCYREVRFHSRRYFHKVCSVDALRVISAELNFVYEVLHTKVLATRSKRSYIFRFVAFIEVAMAFVLFNRFKKHQLPKLDVAITYILLFGGIALDVITLFILVFSDWTVAEIMFYETRRHISDSSLPQPKHSFLHKLIFATVDLKKPRFTTCKAEPNANATSVILDTPLIFRRWSESISACNIVSELLKERPRKMHKRDQCWGINSFSNICSPPFQRTEKIISLIHRTCKMFIGRELSTRLTIPRYTSRNPLNNKLWIFIFEELRCKSIHAHTPIEVKDIFEARGNQFLQDKWWAVDLLDYVTKPNYELSIILWHIATEICYRRENPIERNDKTEFSKTLSDYMLYLLHNQPNVMSTLVHFYEANMSIIRDYSSRFIVKDVEELCKAYTDQPMEALGWGNTLGQGIELAHKMESLGERKWEVTSKVWVEMLSYAAGHINEETHVRVLSQGGELLAFVWLLMAHLGCLYKPEWATYEGLAFRQELETESTGNDGAQQKDVNTVETGRVN